jgi:hypothetical protein
VSSPRPTPLDDADFPPLGALIPARTPPARRTTPNWPQDQSPKPSDQTGGIVEPTIVPDLVNPEPANASLYGVAASMHAPHNQSVSPAHAYQCVTP